MTTKRTTKRRSSKRRREIERWRLVQTARGKVDVDQRRGPHATVLGGDVHEDCAARLSIIRTYRYILGILHDEPQDGSDPDFILDWLHGYIAAHTTASRKEARKTAQTALSAIESERLRGNPSKSRRIVREILSTTGVWDGRDGVVRLKVSDDYLRRLIRKGDPSRLPARKVREARKTLASRDELFGSEGASVATEGCGQLGWRLQLVRRPKLGGLSRVVDLILYGPGPVSEESRKRGRLGPKDLTPIGTAANVVREWADHRKRSAACRELADLFLRRRR